MLIRDSSDARSYSSCIKVGTELTMVLVFNVACYCVYDVTFNR